jgi:putative PIN family toxin of toxin-antitoxin system
VLLSTATLAELREVLGRKKLRRYVDEGEARLWLALLIHESVWVDDPDEVVECRDPRDDKFLGLAVGGRATHIISGDANLLILDPFRDIRIVSPRQFLAI